MNRYIRVLTLDNVEVRVGVKIPSAKVIPFVNGVRAVGFKWVVRRICHELNFPTLFAVPFLSFAGQSFVPGQVDVGFVFLDDALSPYARPV